MLDFSTLKEGQKISKIELKDGTEVDFSNDPLKYAFFKSGRIERFTARGSIEQYSLENVMSVYYSSDNNLDSGDPALWIISGALLLIIYGLFLFK